MAVPINKTETTYAAIMEVIWAGKYALFLRAEAWMGGPSPGGGASPSKMLTCQILVGEAVAAQKSIACGTMRMERWRDGGMMKD